MCVTVGRVPHTDGLGSTPPGSRSMPGAGSKPTTFWKPRCRACTPSATLSDHAASCWHMAVAEAHTAVHNITCIPKTGRRSAMMVPSAIFTAPEIGDVGLSEAQAKQQGFAVKLVFQFRELGKAQAMGELAGLFKLVVEEGSGKLLGAHIAGAHA